MSNETTTISVNFAKAFPVFPLDGVVLLPHALLRLFVFESRYRQMVERVLDGSGQIAMGVFAGTKWKKHYEGSPPIRGGVCIGQIAQHERLPDGNYRLWLQGVCRARVVEEFDPEGDRLYRTAMLAPVGADETPEDELVEMRQRIMALLREGSLAEVEPVRALMADAAEREESGDPLPTQALLEVLSLSVLGRLTTPEVQYRLLEEGDIFERARIVERELVGYRQLLALAKRQFDPGAPGGITWN